VTRVRVGLTLLVLAAFLGTGAQASFGLPDPAADTAAGTTGAQAPTTSQAPTTCQTPRLKGLPKNPKFTNATIHFKLTNVIPGSAYIVRAGETEVTAGTALGSTEKNQFLLPDQGTKDKKIFITAIVDVEGCENAPWKVQKPIRYHAVTAPAPAPAPAATAPAAPVAGAPVPPVPATPAKVVPTPNPIKPPKVEKPITQRVPDFGPPPSRRAWLTPTDSGARLDQKLTEPKLSRLDQKADKANSSNALIGLGIVAALFAISTVGGFMAFRHKDEVEFEAAMTEQLKHLEEGDPGYEFGGDANLGPVPSPEHAPFAETPTVEAQAVEASEVSAPSEAPTIVPVPAPIAINGASAVPPEPTKPLSEHRAEVEAELSRILNEAGLQAELEGILGDARKEAERHGIALDADLMVQALCEEINGSAKLSDPRRAELRTMFAEIIAEETQQVPAAAQHVPAEGETIATS
jgi:hypothetical protein